MIEVALIFLNLHGPDGREIDISVSEITSLQCKIPNVENRLFAEGVNALVFTTDGKYISVSETCNEIREMLGESK